MWSALDNANGALVLTFIATFCMADAWMTVYDSAVEAVVLDVREDIAGSDVCSDAGSSMHAGSSRHGMLASGLVARRNAELQMRAKTYVLRVRRDVPFRHARILFALALLLIGLTVLVIARVSA